MKAQKAARAALAAFEKSKSPNMDRPSAAGIVSAIAQLHADLRHYEDGLNEVEQALTLLPDQPKYLVQRAELLRLKMRCEAGMGNFGMAKAASDRAAAILRSSAIPEKGSGLMPRQPLGRSRRRRGWLAARTMLRSCFRSRLGSWRKRVRRAGRLNCESCSPHA